MRNTVFLVLLVVASCSCYTLKSSGRKRVDFPVQLNLPQHRKSFQRFHKEKVEIVNCPQGFVFDHTKMICQMDSALTDYDYVNESCPSNYRGLAADPFNCRNFINCHDGMAFLQSCVYNLLFSDAIKNCEWPEDSQCCEYPENMSLKHHRLMKA